MLSQVFHSRQPTLSCNHASFSRHSLHCITFHSLTIAHARYVWVIGFAHSSHITTIFTRFFRNVHFTSFRFITSFFSRQACSPPAAIVVLACAVVRAAGCHDFCFYNCLPLKGDQEGDLTLYIEWCKKSRQPLFVPFVPHSTHSSLPRSLVPQSRSLLTPYLLLADSLRGGHFVRLGGSQI